MMNINDNKNYVRILHVKHNLRPRGTVRRGPLVQ